MRIHHGISLLFALLLPEISRSQTHAQKYQVEKLSFQYRSNNNKKGSRCLYWYPLSESKDRPLEYNKAGQPFIRVQVRAKVNADCKVTAGPAPSIKVVPSSNDTLMLFDVVVKPPVSTFTVDGPNFRDELVFDAPLTKFEEMSFFKFFKKSRVQFELRFASLKTDNPLFTDATVPMFPVFGGNIGVPFPFVNNLIMGYSMFQNLDNIKNSTPYKAQFSEFTFDLKYAFSGKEIWGRPYVAPVVDFRGRNIYQLNSDAALRPFVIGSVAMPGFGVDASWFPVGAFKPFTNWAARIGIDLSYRMYTGGKISGRAFNASILDAGLNYRLGKKWALGGGYSKTTQSAAFPELSTGKINESITNFFVRLILIPYLEEAGK